MRDLKAEILETIRETIPGARYTDEPIPYSYDECVAAFDRSRSGIGRLGNGVTMKLGRHGWMLVYGHGFHYGVHATGLVAA